MSHQPDLALLVPRQCSVVYSSGPHISGPRVAVRIQVILCNRGPDTDCYGYRPAHASGLLAAQLRLLLVRWKPRCRRMEHDQPSRAGDRLTPEPSWPGGGGLVASHPRPLPGRYRRSDQGSDQSEMACHVIRSSTFGMLRLIRMKWWIWHFIVKFVISIWSTGT